MTPAYMSLKSFEKWKEDKRKELIEKLCGDLSDNENINGFITAKIINEVLGDDGE